MLRMLPVHFHTLFFESQAGNASTLSSFSEVMRGKLPVPFPYTLFRESSRQRRTLSFFLEVMPGKLPVPFPNLFSLESYAGNARTLSILISSGSQAGRFPVPFHLTPSE